MDVSWVLACFEDATLLMISSAARDGHAGRALRSGFILVVVLVGLGLLGSYLLSDGAGSASVDEPVHEHVEAIGTAVTAVNQAQAAALVPLSIVEPRSQEEVEPVLDEAWVLGSPAHMKGKLAPNESVFVSLERKGLSASKIQPVVAEMSKLFDFRRSRPGDAWEVEVDAEGLVQRFAYVTSPEDVWETTRSAEGVYAAQKLVIPVETRLEVVRGSISSSLWVAFETAGASGSLAQSFIDLFAYTIDFNTETQAGDTFAAVYERVYLDGKHLRNGRVVAAHYAGSVGEFYGFYNQTGEDSGYYDEEGENLRRQFLKSPLPTIRITSKFGRRFHPVLKKMKLHAGVDYGAPTGTPVHAAADGVVTHAGWKGANGKLVSIRHSGGYVTHYAHLSKIQKGLKRGKKVSQKQVIGRVGTTGRSTGPHLHYGMTLNGRHVNPTKVDSAKGEPLAGKAREKYIRSVVEPLKARLANEQ